MRSIITLALLVVATEAFMPATPGKAVSASSVFQYGEQYMNEMTLTWHTSYELIL